MAALTDADLAAAVNRLLTNSDEASALVRSHKIETDQTAQAIAQDKDAVVIIEQRMQALALTVGAGSANTPIAAEGENFQVADQTWVRFGVGTKWVEKLFDGAPHVCNLPTFGTDVDPAPNQVKSCVIGRYTG